MIDSTDMADEATQFIEFLLSPTAQEYFATETFEYPLTNDVSPAAGLPDLDQIAAPDIDLSRLADVLDDATRLVTESGLV
jgi:iron(III) transport system substrate-binding protein